MISEERENELEKLISKLKASNNIILEYINKEFKFPCNLLYRVLRYDSICLIVEFRQIDDYRNCIQSGYSEKIKEKCLEIVNQLGYLQDKGVSINIRIQCYDEEANKLQYSMKKKAMKILEKDLKKFKVKIYKSMCIPYFGMKMELIIFFEKDSELLRYKENEMTDYIKEKFMEILDEIGYTKIFIDEVKIEFDTDENVKRNYAGNYYFRSLG